MNLEAITASLDAVRQTLEASGFNLEIEEPETAKLTVTVRPGPDACPECLVPKSMFKRIILDNLGSAKLSPSSVVVRYPVDLA
jgi:hypothetical protein